jgi:xylulokinase
MEWLVDNVWAGSQDEGERERLYEQVGRSALAAAPGAAGLLFYTLAGGHSEGYGPGRGGFLRLGLDHSRGDLARAVMEGIGCELRWALEEMRASGVAVEELKMVGGGAKSAAWPQIVADITGLPVELPGLIQAASWGAAILAGVGAGVFPDVSVVQKAANPAPRLEPNPALRGRYDELYEQYRDLCPLVCKT